MIIQLKNIRISSDVIIKMGRCISIRTPTNL